MLARRLAAGPSRALFLRHMATATGAGAQGAADGIAASASASASSSTSASTTSTTSSPASSSSLSNSVPVGRGAARAAAAAAAAAATSVHAAPPRGQRSQLVEQLAEIARQPPAEVTAADAHDSIWQAFRLLTRQERESLTADELSLLLRAVVPRYDQYWKYLYRTPRRAHHRELTVVLATEWEARMRAVVAELEAKRGVTDEDWWFVLRTLANMGLASAVEAIVRDMPDRLRYAAPTSEFRLGAIVRWARNLIDTREAPTPGQVEYAHNTFWDIFRHMKSTQIHVFTLRLLLTTTVEVSTLVKTRSHDESMARLHELVDFIVKHGYGIDLHNIALSVQQLPTLQTTHNITPLSAKGLTAILRHLILRDTDPYRLVAAFDILSTKGSTATSNYSSRNDDDDDDDFGPPAAAVQEGDPDRRNWLGFKVKKNPDGSASESALTKEEIDVQRNRYCLDYLPAFPPLSTITAASAVPASLPPKPAYNDEAIVVILQYLREQNQFKLFKHVLDTSLHTAKASHASWLAAYLSLPAKDSHLLMRPLRIAPEWFRVAFAYSAKQRGRWASRFARSLRDAHASAQQLADAIVAAEIARGTPVTRRSPQARAIVPTPAFAADPRSLRMLRNASVFVVSHDLKALYHDIDGLEALVARSLEVEGARQQRR